MTVDMDKELPVYVSSESKIQLKHDTDGGEVLDESIQNSNNDIEKTRMLNDGQHDNQQDGKVETFHVSSHTSKNKNELEEDVGFIAKKANLTLKQRLLSDNVFRQKFQIWLCLCSFFGVLGWNQGIGGPTLLDLQIISNSSLEQVALFFTAISSGYVVASLVISVTYDRFDKFLHIAVGYVGVAIVMSVIPWCFYYGAMLTMHLLKGFMCGISELATSTLTIHLMGQEVRTYMQILHFSFTFGGIMSPIASAPFLTKFNESSHSSTNVNETATPNLTRSDHWIFDLSVLKNYSIVPGFNLTSPIPTNTQPVSAVYKVYFITGGLSLLPVIISTILFFKCDRKLTVTKSKSKGKKTEQDNGLPLRLLIPVLVTLSFIFFVCFSMEDSIAGFTATYAVKHFHWTKALASYVTSVYWASFSFGSFSGIFIARLFAISKLLQFYSSLGLIASICLLVTSLYEIDLGLWVFTGISGFSLSLNFPLLFAWVEEDFVHVTAKVTALLTISASIGVIISPILIGILMETTTILYSYFVLGESVMLCSLVFIGKLLSLKAKPYRKKFENEIEIDVTKKLNTEL